MRQNPHILPKLTLQQPTQEHGQVLVGWQPSYPPLGELLQGTSGDDAYQVIGAGKEVKYIHRIVQDTLQAQLFPTGPLVENQHPEHLHLEILSSPQDISQERKQ